MKRATARQVSWHDKPVVVPGVAVGRYDTEEAFQIYCATWLRKNWPEVRFHHSANERVGGRSGLKAKLMGQSKGFPDIVLFEIKLAIELKLPKGKLSKEQESWLGYLNGIGWKAVCCRSFEQFTRAINA